MPNDDRLHDPEEIPNNERKARVDSAYEQMTGPGSTAIKTRAPVSVPLVFTTRAHEKLAQHNQDGDIIILQLQYCTECGTEHYKDTFIHKYSLCCHIEDEILDLAAASTENFHSALVLSKDLFQDMSPLMERVGERNSEQTERRVLSCTAGYTPANFPYRVPVRREIEIGIHLFIPAIPPQRCHFAPERLQHMIDSMMACWQLRGEFLSVRNTLDHCTYFAQNTM